MEGGAPGLPVQGIQVTQCTWIRCRVVHRFPTLYTSLCIGRLHQCMCIYAFETHIKLIHYILNTHHTYETFIIYAYIRLLLNNYSKVERLNLPRTVCVCLFIMFSVRQCLAIYCTLSKSYIYHILLHAVKFIE